MSNLDSAVETALTQVRADLLSSIVGTGNYYYTLVEVHRDVVEKDTVMSPGVIMMPGRVVHSANRQASNNRRFLTVPLTLAGVLKCGNTDITKDRALNALGADILLAMTSKANILHSNTVLNTRFEGMETVHTPDEILGIVLLDFELDVHNTWDAP